MTKRTRWLGLVLALATCAALLAPGSARALPVSPPKIGVVCLNGPTFNLQTKAGNIQTPEGNQIFMWSYSDSSGLFQYPGPVLCVIQGQTVTVNLTNNLPEPSSIVFPGQEGVSASGTGTTAGLLTTEAPTGVTVTYTFTASSPGTYLYESGSNVTKQVEMGLYGALIVRPSNPAYAYDSSTQFDPGREYMLLLSEIDPDLHHAVEVGGAYDFNALHNRYFMVNGRGFPDTLQSNGTGLLPTQPYGALIRLQPMTPTNQPALIRMLNAGVDNHPFHPHGNHTREIAQDGRPIKTGSNDASTEHFGETIGSGQTLDYLIRWDNTGTDSSGAAFNDNWNPLNNTLPPQPNYTKLLFTSPTFYSGNPYLGYKGTLPTGTPSLNVCGEWYFPMHSHALNEFVNFDEPFGGMATLLRVDPFGGCFTSPTSTTIVGGLLKSGTYSALAVDNETPTPLYYQVNPKTTTLSGTINTTTSPTTTLGPAITSTTATTLTVTANGFPAAPYYIRIDSEVLQVTAKSGLIWTVSRGQLGSLAATHSSGAGVAYVIGVASASGFPSTGNYYIRIDSEVLQVTGGQGTRAWNVSRGQLGTVAATHLTANATVTALANDWYAAFSGVATGAQNFQVTYKGKNCTGTTGAACAPLTTNLPQQTVKICSWAIVPTGCSASNSIGWVTLPGLPTQPQSVGSTDLSSTWTIPGLANNYIGAGAYKGQVRILVHTDRWTATDPTAFSTWGNFMKLVYDAP